MVSRTAKRLGGHEVSSGDVVDLINHIALPPKLPTSKDEQPTVIEQNLLYLAQAAIATLDTTSSQAWSRVSNMLHQLDNIKQKNGYSHAALALQLSGLKLDGEYSFASFQHSLMISRLSGDSFACPELRRLDIAQERRFYCFRML
jgi:hypothetical protein